MLMNKLQKMCHYNFHLKWQMEYLVPLSAQNRKTQDTQQSSYIKGPILYHFIPFHPEFHWRSPSWLIIKKILKHISIDL